MAGKIELVCNTFLNWIRYQKACSVKHAYVLQWISQVKEIFMFLHTFLYHAIMTFGRVVKCVPHSETEDDIEFWFDCWLNLSFKFDKIPEKNLSAPRD